MARARRRTDEDESSEERHDLASLLKEVAVALVIVGGVFGAIFAYTQTYPPIVVVESSSMQHSDVTSFIGVIDTGDLVLVQAARSRSDVVTWIEGRVSGHSTYGDFGDVIVFQKPSSPAGSVPVIHRAILYVEPNGGDAYDIPELSSLPPGEWEGVNRTGQVTQQPVALVEVTIHGMGWQHDLGITFDLGVLAQNPINRRPGFITMGDNNAYDACITRDPCGPFPPYDQSWVVPVGNILGRARGEIPWFGLVKLTYQPTLVRMIGAILGVVAGVMLPRTNRNVVLIGAAILGGVGGYLIAGLVDPVSPPSGGACCDGWGDPIAPRNSWDSLLIALPLLFGSPLIAEGVVWSWTRYAAPWLRRRFRRSEETLADDVPEEDSAGADPPEPR